MNDKQIKAKLDGIKTVKIKAQMDVISAISEAVKADGEYEFYNPEGLRYPEIKINGYSCGYLATDIERASSDIPKIKVKIIPNGETEGINFIAHYPEKLVSAYESDLAALVVDGDKVKESVKKFLNANRANYLEKASYNNRAQEAKERIDSAIGAYAGALPKGFKVITSPGKGDYKDGHENSSVEAYRDITGHKYRVTIITTCLMLPDNEYKVSHTVKGEDLTTFHLLAAIHHFKENL